MDQRGLWGWRMSLATLLGLCPVWAVPISLPWGFLLSPFPLMF